MCFCLATALGDNAVEEEEGHTHLSSSPRIPAQADVNILQRNSMNVAKQKHLLMISHIHVVFAWAN